MAALWAVFLAIPMAGLSWVTVSLATDGQWFAVLMVLMIGVIPVFEGIEGLADLWAEFKRDGGAS